MYIMGTPTNFPQGFAYGLNVRGVPILQSQPGQVYWLDNGSVLMPGQHSGSDNNRGTFLDPFATLSHALAMTVPGRGDIIMVGSGHAETFTSLATSPILAASGVAVIGVGAGVTRPTFTFSTASTTNILVAGASMSLQNLLFVGNFLSIASVFTESDTSFTGVIDTSGLLTASGVTGSIYPGVTLAGTGVPNGTVVLNQVSGTAYGAGTYMTSTTTAVTSTTMTSGPSDFSIDGCEFRDTSSSLGFLCILTTSATANQMNRFSMTRNVWNSLSTVSPTVALTVGANEDGWNITDNIMNSPITAVTQGPILMAAGANSLTNFSLGRNRLQRPNTSSSIPAAISTSGTAWSGLAYDNYIGAVPSGTGVWINTGTKLSFINNYSQITGAADKSALINPSAV